MTKYLDIVLIFPEDIPSGYFPFLLMVDTLKTEKRIYILMLENDSNDSNVYGNMILSCLYENFLIIACR